MKKNVKLYLLFAGLIVIIALLLFLLVYFFNNRNKNYTFKEKNWINSNTNEVIDLSMEGSLPLFSNNGEGIFYDYIKALEKDTKLTFNIVVNGNANYSFSNKNIINNNDIVFYTGNYVLVSTINKKITNINALKDQPIGVIKGDKDYITNYFKSYNFEYIEYSNISELKNDMNNTIVYAIIPMEKYINEIVYNKYNIVYQIDGLHSYYTLSLNTSNVVLNSVFTKFLNKWQENIDTNMKKYLLNIFYQANGLTELEKETITANDLIVGYIDNMPYEGKLNNDFSGITNEYLNGFSKMTDATYKFIKYKNTDDLLMALNNKKVDLVINYYNINNSNYNNIELEGTIDYVLVTSINNNLSYDNLNSIKNSQVKMLNNTVLYSYIKSQNIDVNVYNSFNDLFKSLEADDLLIVEKSTYDYFKNSALKKYVIKFIDTTNNNNSYLINADNKILNKLFGFYLSTVSTRKINNIAISSSSKSLSRNMIFEFIINNIIYIILLLFALFFLIFKLNKRIKITKKIKKEDKMLYLDVMTNLKNRNYLNDNLVYWEANKVYPQTIVIVDLNDIAVINDTKGHEEGDKQIQSAARILINTQRENSEIVRTNGNEFLIYLVGYDEKQIVTYVNKLMKEFKNLPYDFGASVGYYMITSESVTIDDAINEALIMMRKNKGE